MIQRAYGRLLTVQEMPVHTFILHRLLQPCLLILLAWMLTGCSVLERQKSAAQRSQARGLFDQRCQQSGEKIYKTVEGVEGLYLMKVRPNEQNFGNQFKLSDPYGDALGGDAYIGSFLRGFFPKVDKPTPLTPVRLGYLYVEVSDPQDGKHYRYTGRIEEPWQTDKRYLKGYMRFALDRLPIAAPSAKYGVTYDDISTREDREHWIAGSSIRVIDLATGEVVAERIGFMLDPAQGSSEGGRSPWLLAANTACPAFLGAHGSTDQIGQTVKFVEKVLKPKP